MIPEESFGKIIKYHLLDQEQEADDIRKGLEKKLDAMVNREVYSKSKTAPTKEEIAEFEELMRKTIADIVSEVSSVACWVYVQKYVKQKTLDEMLQELPDVGQFIIAIG